MAKIIVTLINSEKIVLVKTHDVAAAKRVKRDVLRWVADGNIILFPSHENHCITIREVPSEQIKNIEIEEPGAHS